jgi:hypothetical protein
MKKQKSFRPTLEALEDRLTPSGILPHRGLTPLSHTALVPPHSGSGGFRPPPPGGLTVTIWDPQNGSVDGTAPGNWTAGLPSSLNIGHFDHLYSDGNCNLTQAVDGFAGFVMKSAYAGTVTFSGADGTVAAMEDHSTAGWYTFNMNLSSNSLTIDAGANISGTGTFTLTAANTGTIAVPAGATCILSCADFVINGTLSASGEIYLGNGTTGTSFLSIGNGGTVQLLDTGSFAGSGSSNVRVGDASTGGGTMLLAVNKTWTSGVSVYLRHAGGSDQFGLAAGSTFDFSGTTVSYTSGGTTWNNVCLAEDGPSGIHTNYVTLNAGATLNLYNNAVIQGSLIAQYTASSGQTDTVGSHSGNTASLVLTSTATLSNGQGNTSYFGTLSQNANVFSNGATYNANIKYTSINGNWFGDGWIFGSSYGLTLSGGATDLEITGTGLPNPYSTSQALIYVPYGVTGANNWTGHINDNNWSLGTLALIYGYQLLHP